MLALSFAAACSPVVDHGAPLLGDCDAGPRCGTSSGSSGTGGGQLPDSGDGGKCGVIVFKDPRCDPCIADKCCARNATCSDNVDCLAVFSCISNCNDPMCVLRCRDRSQNGVPDYDNFIDCKTNGCSTECATKDAGSLCGTLAFKTKECDACVAASCCKEASTCSNNPDCFALFQCVGRCPASDQTCASDCQTTHPIGAGDYRSLTQCLQASCASQCQ